MMNTKNLITAFELHYTILYYLVLIMLWWAILLIVLGSVIGFIGILVIGYMIYLAATADSRK